MLWIVTKNVVLILEAGRRLGCNGETARKLSLYGEANVG
jgi:hypothetical protein